MLLALVCTNDDDVKNIVSVVVGSDKTNSKSCGVHCDNKPNKTWRSETRLVTSSYFSFS